MISIYTQNCTKSALIWWTKRRRWHHNTPSTTTHERQRTRTRTDDCTRPLNPICLPVCEKSIISFIEYNTGSGKSTPGILHTVYTIRGHDTMRDSAESSWVKRAFRLRLESICSFRVASLLLALPLALLLILLPLLILLLYYHVVRYSLHPPASPIP